MKTISMITVIVLIAVTVFGFEGLLYRNMTRRPDEVEQVIWDFSGKVHRWRQEDPEYDLYTISTKYSDYHQDYPYGHNMILFRVPKNADFEKFAEGDVVDIYGALYIGNCVIPSLSPKTTVPLFTITEDTTGTYRKVD
ncbi:MAG TPA: hypothetical protein PLV00_08170 [Caldisericia bacterium]|nr:hypothetical protein [Caldisericia bacterium]